MFFDIDGSHNVFVLSIRGSREDFAEDAQSEIASDESHEMIATFLRLIQWMPWGLPLAREDQFPLGASQCLKRSFPFEFAIAIGAVVPVFERQRFFPKLYHGRHGDLVEKLLLVMVVEFFDHSVPPWLRRWNEPEIDSIMQAETDKRSHASGMGWTSIKGQLIVHLKVLRDAHTQPERINRV